MVGSVAGGVRQQGAAAPAKPAEVRPAEKKSAPATAADGRSVYHGTCSGCHTDGKEGSPVLGDRTFWIPRIKAGKDALYASANKGKGKMPPRGGNNALSEADLKAAVDYMVLQAIQSSQTAAAVPAPAAPAAEANTFNRLLRAAGKRNLPPADDGIHDAANDGTHLLQPPAQAFTVFPKSTAGNGVNWVESLSQKKIAPRYDRKDPAAAPVVMDLNIVREVKGSMPDVVYPHKQHTEWLDCSNCHPAIFIPQKGANQISMASIILGQKCGVCHGKVAFPVSECRLCHSKKKETAVSQAGTGK
ncbi:MAG: c-type cytochrome [Betaproteobacteria bacterium]|nr:c-type cytochrome [Betaproteobacteria bacterium]